jgi:hypothetical protein
MLMGVPVTVAMSTSTGWRGQLLRFPLVDGEECLDRFHGIRVFAGNGANAPFRHALSEPLAERVGEDDVDTIDGVSSGTAEIVHRHLLGQIEPLDLGGFAVGLDVIDQEPSCSTGVAGDGAEILACYGDSHRCGPS